MVGLARTREIVNNTMNPVNSTRIVFMTHLLGEKGKTTTSHRCETEGSARNIRRREGTAAVETVTRCHTTPLDCILASLPVSNRVKRAGTGSGHWIEPMRERDIERSNVRSNVSEWRFTGTRDAIGHPLC
jgi:hypothetical protein